MDVVPTQYGRPLSVKLIICSIRNHSFSLYTIVTSARFADHTEIYFVEYFLPTNASIVVRKPIFRHMLARVLFL